MKPNHGFSGTHPGSLKALDTGLFCNQITGVVVKGTPRSIVVIWAHISLNELMVEIYSKSLVRAFGKVLCMQFS